MKIFGGVTTVFIGNYFEWQAGNSTKYYYAGATRVALRQGANPPQFLLGDHLGSTTRTASAAGATSGMQLYRPWGETHYTSGSLLTQYQYTGQWKSASGLYWYNSRWYDSALGRFVQPDTLIPAAAQGTQAWDRYAYANNNPVRYNDPSGHCILCVVAAVAGGVILGTAIYNNFIHQPSAPADGNASTVGGLVGLGYEHAGHANIVGEGLQSLKDDPSFQAAQRKAINDIKNNPGYRKVPYSVSNVGYKNFTANGSSGHWIQAALEPNQAFYMVHSSSVSATNTSVAEDGTITTTWVVEDTFDYLPKKGEDIVYNTFAVIVYFGYNIVLGAENELPTTASYQETIPPPKDQLLPR